MAASRKKKLIIGVASLFLLAGAGVGAWVYLKPPPPPPDDGPERTYDQIDRKEYEDWMRSLGYTE